MAAETVLDTTDITPVGVGSRLSVTEGETERVSAKAGRMTEAETSVGLAASALRAGAEIEAVRSEEMKRKARTGTASLKYANLDL